MTAAVAGTTDASTVGRTDRPSRSELRRWRRERRRVLMIVVVLVLALLAAAVLALEHSHPAVPASRVGLASASAAVGAAVPWVVAVAAR